MSRLKVGVVGVGALGRHHARILSTLNSVELVAVADANTETAERVAAQCNTRSVADYREMLDLVEAACIAVPTFAHLSVATDFLNCRIPVLIEKPVASNLDQARELVSLAERQHTLLQVGHIERFNPVTAAASRHIGDPKYIRAQRVSPYAFRSTDIGVVHDMMIHDIDLVLSLVQSPVRKVDAFGVCLFGGNEDCVQARVAFENGCIADLTANRVSPTTTRTLQTWSERGMVAVDFAAREIVCYTPSETLLYGASPLERAKLPGANIEQLKQDAFGTFVKVTRPEIPKADALEAELASFVDCVRQSREPLVGGREALAAMTLADQILQSVASHQWDGHAAGAIGPNMLALDSSTHKRAG